MPILPNRSFLLLILWCACSSEGDRRNLNPYGGETPGDGGINGKSDGPGDTYVLAEWVGPTMWPSILDTITVDSAERVYVATETTIYWVVDDVPAIHTHPDALMPLVSDLEVRLVSLDTGPDDRIYALHDYNQTRVLVLDAPESVELWGTSSNVIFPQLASVVSPEQVVLLASGGLFSTEPGGGDATLLYGSADFAGGSTDCFSEDMETTYTGYVFYLPGCTGDSIYGGPLTGGIGLLAENADVEGDTFVDFAGVGRHPGGGVVVSVERALYRFQEDGSYAEIRTVPTLGELADDTGDSFHGRPVAVGPSGAIYIASMTTIYRAALQ